MEGTLLVTIIAVTLCGGCSMYVIWRKKRRGSQLTSRNKKERGFDEEEKRVKIEMWKRGHDEWGTEEKKLTRFLESVMAFSKADKSIPEEKLRAMELAIPVLKTMQSHGSCSSKKDLASLPPDALVSIANGCEQTLTGLTLIQSFCKASDEELLHPPTTSNSDN
eukprot:TRINITY_DN22622_c0_g1_i1.p1 TRINITY_DN22622_c0_g1~~TRINITY_DN22622_c0_g1_i1.p1  ORF type:complete len:164 (+),score=29.62 TRINITY_DN22622_c0_g1_i1:87-578(+)